MIILLNIDKNEHFGNVLDPFFGEKGEREKKPQKTKKVISHANGRSKNKVCLCRFMWNL